MTIYASRMNDTGTFFDYMQRPVIDLGILCTPIEISPKKLCIKLPFGTELCPTHSQVNIGLLEATVQTLDQISTALAPMMPFFRIMDAVLSVAKTVTVIKDILGPPPNLKPLLDAIAEMVPKILYLVKQMPIFTLPLMVVNILDMMIALFEGAANEFETVARHIKRIQTAEINVRQAAGLLPLIGCAKSSMATHMDNLEHLLAVVNPIIDMINLIAAAFQVGGDAFPLKRWDGIEAKDALVTASALRVAADALHLVRNKIPI